MLVSADSGGEASAGVFQELPREPQRFVEVVQNGLAVWGVKFVSEVVFRLATMLDEHTSED